MPYVRYTDKTYYNGVCISTRTDALVSTGVDSGTFRTADVSGVFIPGTYKTTPFSASTWRAPADSGPVTLTRNWISGPSLYQEVIEGPVSSFGASSVPTVITNLPNFNAAKTEALLRALGNVGNGKQLELATELGELRETLDLLAGTINNLWYFLRHPFKVDTLRQIILAERGRSKWTRKGLRELPDKWMEFRYGWLPLVRSISDALEVFREGLKKLELMPDRIFTARGKSLSSDTVKGTVSTGHWMWPITMKYNVVYDHTARAFVHYKVLTAPTIPDYVGLSLKYLPETAWELTSCSFVWDWFFGIGNWLAGARGILDFDFAILGNVVGVKTAGKGVRTYEMTRTDFIQEGSMNGFHELSSYHRTPNVPFPLLPGLRASINIDWKKIVDLFIIGSQRLPKSLKRRNFLGI